MSNSKIKTSIRSNLLKSPHVGLLKRLDEVDKHHTSIPLYSTYRITITFFYNVICLNFNLAAFHTKLEKLCTISCSVLAVSETAKMAHFSVASLFQIGLLLVLICWTKESTGAAFSLEEEFK